MSSRRIRWFHLAAAFACALAVVSCDRGGGNRRNVLLVVVDTVRADRLSLYGAEVETTPFLADLAAEATVFDQAMATSSWTLPSFGSLFTGRWLSRHNAGISVEFRSNDDVVLAQLDSTVWTLAEVLQREKYSTAAFVNNPFLNPGLGLARGFDLYDYAHADNQNLRRANQMVDRVLEWFGRTGRGPWFVTVHLFDPHMNYDPPPAVRGTFTAGYDGFLNYPIDQLDALRKGYLKLNPEDQEFVRGAYDEEVLFVDQQLRRLFDGLRAAGRLEDTVVVVTSDHGEELFDHGGFEHGHALYQEVIRIPMLVLGPGVTARHVETPVSLVDVSLTVLEALDLAPPGDADGMSLWPTATLGSPLPARSLISEGVLYVGNQRALLEWPYKLIAQKDSDAHELYRLDEDPSERVDLAAQDPTRAANMRQRLEALIKEAAKERVKNNLAKIPPEVRERLRALGYID